MTRFQRARTPYLGTSWRRQRVYWLPLGGQEGVEWLPREIVHTRELENRTVDRAVAPTFRRLLGQGLLRYWPHMNLYLRLMPTSEPTSQTLYSQLSPYGPPVTNARWFVS